MKSVFFFSLMSLTILTTGSAWAAQDWKVIAETTKCTEKFKVLAKEGEKFVYVVDAKEAKTKLSSEDGATFSDHSGKSVIFSNHNDKTATNTNKFTFVQPSMVDGNPPKLDVSLNSTTGEKDNCKMSLK
jgi:hypothetical protein